MLIPNVFLCLFTNVFLFSLQMFAFLFQVISCIFSKWCLCFVPNISCVYSKSFLSSVKKYIIYIQVFIILCHLVLIPNVILGLFQMKRVQITQRTMQDANLQCFYPAAQLLNTSITKRITLLISRMTFVVSDM